MAIFFVFCQKLIHNMHLRQKIRALFTDGRITIVNVIGLSISLAATLFMLLWVEDELSFDRFHDDYKRLYRVEEDQYYSGQEAYHVNVTPYVSGPVWRDEVPEIIDQCRFAYQGGMLFTHEESRFFEEGIVAVDSSFFDMFSFSFKYGQAHGILRDPYSLVLTEDLATKYFGEGDPVGEVLTLDQEHTFVVAAVLDKLPSNTVLGFRVLLPFSFLQQNDMVPDSWGTNSIRTLVKLQEGSIDSIVNRKITAVTNLYKENNTIDFMLAPLHRVHLHSYFGYGKSAGAVMYVYIFTAIALFVLVIACINFMNLATARASIRAREIGLRKVNGASRSRLARMTLGESFIQVLVSVLLALMLVALFLAKFNLLSGKSIQLQALLSLKFVGGIAIITSLTTFLAGLYPAFYLSALDPLHIIREQQDRRTASGLLRKVLVVFQFSLAILLICGALISKRQLNFMRNAPLGYDKHHLVHLQLRGKLNAEYELLKEELSALPGVLSSSASMEPPFRIGSNSGGIDWEGKDPDMSLLVSFTGVHHDFIKTMGISLASGRDFSAEFPADMYRDSTANFIINERLAGIIGKEEVLGMELDFIGASGTVVGIMEDYHFQPLGNEIEPMALAPVPTDMLYHMVVRLSPERPEAGLAAMEERWAELLPQYPFEANLVEDVIDDMYRSEERMSSLLGIFTLIALVIAALGLFALASFTAQRRTREIGIRKVLGASTSQVSGMLVRDFSFYILISLLIALPAVWLLGRKWLEAFSYHIRLSADLFVLTTVLTASVAILTVLFHALRSSRANPVEALRHE